MRDGTPKRRAPRPTGRRNLSAVAEAAGMPAEYRVTKYEKGDCCERLWVERREVRDRKCPRCGHDGRVNGHYRRRVWHLPFRGGAQLALMLDQVRLRCPRCGKCWSDGHDGLVSDVSRHMTAALADTIHDGLMLRKSVKECTAEYGPSRHLVNKVVESALVDWQYMPHTLCIDEFKADTDAGRMAVGIYDGDAGRIIEVLPDMRRETIDWFFDRFTEEERSQVAFFCSDMSPEMVAVQQRWFPRAMLCIDRFHVVKLAGRALSDVRRRVEADKTIDPALRRELRGSWRLLVMGREKLLTLDDEYAMEMSERRSRVQRALSLTDEEMNEIPRLRVREPKADRLERLLSASGELRVSYALYQDLRLIHQAGKVGWWDGMPKELETWRGLCRRSGIPEMAALAATVNRNKEDILNSYRHERTNAVAEGINNSIKVTKRRGYGIRRFSAFRRRILIAMGLGRAEVIRLTIRDLGDGEAR